MNNRYILDRIKKQIPESKEPEKKKTIAHQPVESKPSLTPIDSASLKEMIMNELVPTPAEETQTPTTNHVFNGIEEFVVWYDANQDKFDERQKIALSTLKQAASIINVGCKCKRNGRLKQANDYFKTFWMNNQKTNLPEKVLLVGGYSSVTFSIDNEPFVKFPTL